MEEWRQVKEFPNYYISNNNGWKRNGQEIKGCISKGYRYVSVGKHTHSQLFHILVAKAFPEICGEWYKGCYVHHINHNRMDNRPENLVVLTASEHSKLHYQDQPDSFKKPSIKRSASISKALKGKPQEDKRIPIIQLSRNGEIIKKWDYISDVVQDGFDPSNVCSCCKGKLKSAYGFKWQYADKSLIVN